MKIKVNKKITLETKPEMVGFTIHHKGKDPIYYGYGFQHALEYILCNVKGKKAKSIKQLIKLIKKLPKKKL